MTGPAGTERRRNLAGPTTIFVVRRLLSIIPVLFAASVFVFLMIHLVPGDPVRSMLGFHASDQNVATTRESLGLDKPLLEQYLTWLGHAFQGNLGEDLISHTPVKTLVWDHLPVTLELALVSAVLGFVIGVGLGLIGAARGGAARRGVLGFASVGVAIPYFWLGIMLALLVAGEWHLLPPSGYAPFSSQPLENIRYMTLPVLTLAIGEAAYVSRVTAGIAEQILQGPSIAFLESKGLSRASILFKHVLRQASPPLVTVLGIEIGVLLGGAVIVETIFGLPGLGSLVVTAVQQRNYTVVQGSVLVISAMFVIATLLVDLAVGLLDRRVSDGR